jgi:hypothetical protein
MRPFIRSSRFLVGANIPARWRQRKRVSHGRSPLIRLATSAHGEIPEFRYGRPYFGFAGAVQ